MSDEVEAYVNGELSEEARQAFEQPLLLDAALRSEVEQQRQLVESLGYIKLKQNVKAAILDVATQQAQKRKAVLLVSAIGICILALLVWYFTGPAEPALEHTVPPQSQPENSQQSQPLETEEAPQPTSQPANTTKRPPIAQQPNQPTAAPDRYRGDDNLEAIDSSYLGQYQLAMRNFPPTLPSGGSFAKESQLLQKADYKTALKLLSKREALSASNDTVQYLTAVALLYSGKPSAASQRLFLLNSPGNAFQQESQGLLGLSYLLQGRDDAARQVFEMIGKDRKHARQEAALSLLDSLE
ncbi:MAG: hypothetical protein IT258_17610 [Saprospiraceae bacterium]|nr:hypothetical protein [Saprospiraceae bacterium]